MIIDALSGKIINTKKVYIHDDILEEFYFNRQEKKLHLVLEKDALKNECDNKRFSIDFLHVIGFKMTSCDFWGRSPHILDFEYVENNRNTLIPELFERKDNEDFQFCPLKDREKYFETIITFTSGDQLIVACEKIII